MASFAISAAINIGVGLLINLLFAPDQPDIVQEGPRLSDLNVTSSAYGRDIPIHYGTVRSGGNVIWSPGIEEVATSTRQESGGGKGGGGGSVTNTTFTYFASFALGIAEGVAEDILQIFADGKLIYDKTGGNNFSIGNLNFRFYPGDETQLPDPLIEATEGVGNVPAHRGLAYIVFEKLALANFANRIPNITVVITYNSFANMPFTSLTELAGAQIPGSSIGADSDSHMFLDPFSDALYMFKDNDDGLTRSSTANMTMQVAYQGNQGLSAVSSRYCMNEMIYVQDGGSNDAQFKEIDPISMSETGFTLGANLSLGTWGDPFEYPNGAEIGVLRVGAPEFGVDFVDIYVISNNVATADPGGFVVVYPFPPGLKQDNHITDTDIGRGGPVIQDLVNLRCFNTQENDTTVDLWEITASISFDTFGPFVSKPEKQLVGSYAKGGVDYAGTDDTTGWCILPDEEAMILSNGISMFKVDMDSGAVLARNLTIGFESEDQWTTTGLFGFGDGNSSIISDGFLTTISTENLAVLETQNLNDANFPDGFDGNNFPKAAYDPRSHSLIFSRLFGANVVNDRVVKLQLQRGLGLGVPLDGIVRDLSLRAGLEDAEIDVTSLVGETVEGFSSNRQTPVRSALEPLQQAFLFEGVETDFIMKFVRRGGAPVLTVDADDLGRVGRNESDEFVKEVRVQEVELPMRVSVTHSDPDNDYQPGTQLAKRVQNPVPTMESGAELKLDLPIVFNDQPAKQLAERVLYTVWAERASLETTIPWKYIRLDPTDVFQTTYRGDLRRLRMARMEIGAGLELEFTATQEDSRSDDSDVVSDGGSGVPIQVVPSGLPTRFLPLDIPLLIASDASLGQFSRAYWTAAGYDATWPGMLLFRSRDNGATFQEIGASSSEAAWGTIKTVIPAPITTLTWDDSATIDVQVVRGIDRFVSSTDIEVLNGANAMAVAGPSGPEIIQFVNVTSVDAGTVRLSRLLRGRRGTDIPELTDNHVAGETAVLLELGRILTFQNPLDLVDKATPFNATTLNTTLEEGVQTIQTYTGQDLKPYSVVNVTSNLATRTGDLTMDWVRRTRYNGELVDGIGDVPLNETTESYSIDFRFAGDIILTKTVVTNSATVTLAEFNALSHPDGPTARLLLTGEVPLINPDFEQGTEGTEPTGWIQFGSGGGSKQDAVFEDAIETNAQVGTFFLWMGDDAVDDAEVRQEIDLAASGYNIESLDINNPTCTITYFHQEVRSEHDDTTQVIVEFLNSIDAVISNLDSGAITPVAEDTWEQVTFNGPVPTGTRKIRVRMQGHRFGTAGDTAEVMFDNVRLQIGTGVPPLIADIYQISDVVGRGRKTTVVV